MGLFDAWKTGMDMIGQGFKKVADDIGQTWTNAMDKVGSTYDLAFDNFEKGNVTGGIAKFLEGTAGGVGNTITLGYANKLGDYIYDTATDHAVIGEYVDDNTGADQYATKATDPLGFLVKLGVGMANDQIEQDHFIDEGDYAGANWSGVKTLGKDAVAVAGTAALVHTAFAIPSAFGAEGAGTTFASAKEAWAASKLIRRGKLATNVASQGLGVALGSNRELAGYGVAAVSTVASMVAAIGGYNERFVEEAENDAAALLGCSDFKQAIDEAETAEGPDK